MKQTIIFTIIPGQLRPNSKSTYLNYNNKNKKTVSCRNYALHIHTIYKHNTYLGTTSFLWCNILIDNIFLNISKKRRKKKIKYKRIKSDIAVCTFLMYPRECIFHLSIILVVAIRGLLVQRVSIKQAVVCPSYEMWRYF